MGRPHGSPRRCAAGDRRFRSSFSQARGRASRGLPRRRARPARTRLFVMGAAVDEEDVREHLDQGTDGLYRYRYCRSAVVTAYGELCTPPPPPETLRVSTLLVHAGEFGLVREEQLDAYITVLGELLEVVEVPGGHMVFWDAYDETASALERFLEDPSA